MRSDAAPPAEDRGIEGLDFESLWKEWRPRAIAYCRAFPRLTAEDAQDLASEALLKAWSASERYDPARPFAPWFLAILRRLILDRLERERESPVPAELIETRASRAQEAEERILRESEAEFTRRFVEGLGDRDRELASLIYGQDLSVAEAARLTGLPAGSVKWRLFEIRKALRRAWEREYGQTS